MHSSKPSFLRLTSSLSPPPSTVPLVSFPPPSLYIKSRPLKPRSFHARLDKSRGNKRREGRVATKRCSRHKGNKLMANYPLRKIKQSLARDRLTLICPAFIWARRETYPPFTLACRGSQGSDGSSSSFVRLNVFG